jgi:hypothetical protein
MTSFTAGREEVSNGNYTLLVVLMLGLAVGNACMNGFYGSEQATTWGKVVLVTSLFFLGDLVLIALAHYLFPKAWTNAFATVALVGFAVLSMFSATAFLVGQQHEQDNPQLVILDNDIAKLEAKQATYPEDGQRALQRRISELQDKRLDYITTSTQKGTFMTGASAIYHWLSKVTGFSVEAVSLFVRSCWSFVFVVGSMALGGMLNTMYSPKQLKRYSDHLTSRTKTEIDGLHNYRTETDTSNVRTITNEPYQASVGTVQPTGTVSDELYRKVKQMIVNGELKPSVRHVKPVVGSTDVAAQYLRDLSEEGVLNKQPNGYKLAV